MPFDYIKPTDLKILFHDVELLARWMKTDHENLYIDLTHEPITKFSEQIQELKLHYVDFPKEAERTNKIVNTIKNGAPCLPVYVERNDPNHFIMEGRHRIVAFQILGIHTIPVAYVSLKSQPKKRLLFDDLD